MRVRCTEENENPQRQPPTASRQMRNNAVTEPFAAKAALAEEKYEQANNVDRQAPGELQKIEKYSGPARNTDCCMGILSFPAHIQRLLWRFVITEYRIAQSFFESE